jgi:hypothetical protein
MVEPALFKALGTQGPLASNRCDQCRTQRPSGAAWQRSREQEAVAKHYADITNEQVIEDLVDVNYGIDEPAPLIKFETETDKRYAGR